MNTDKVIQIFIEIDDFVKDLDETSLKRDLLGDFGNRRNRKSKLSLSEKNDYLRLFSFKWIHQF